MSNIIQKPFRYRYSNVVMVLIGINILVFLAMMLLRQFRQLQYQQLMIFYLALFPPAIFQGWVWQFVTYMFVHSPTSISHIIFNMLALFIFGTHVERHMGSREFLLYYFLTGALAGFFSFIIYVFTGSMMVFLMGASGAIFAVQLAYAAFFPRSHIYIWGILPVRAPIMVLGFTALGLIFMITGRGGNVAHVTHLAGFGFGWLYFLVRFRINPWRAMRS